MAAQSLLSAAGNGNGSGVSHTGACFAVLESDSVLDGATVDIEICNVDTAAKYAPLRLNLQKAKTTYIGATGTYYLRGVVAEGGSSVSINLTTNQ